MQISFEEGISEQKIPPISTLFLERSGKLLRETALENDVELDVIKPWKEKTAKLDPYDCLLVLGGGPNVDQEK